MPSLGRAVMADQYKMRLRVTSNDGSVQERDGEIVWDECTLRALLQTLFQATADTPEITRSEEVQISRIDFADIIGPTEVKFCRVDGVWFLTIH